LARLVGAAERALVRGALISLGAAAGQGLGRFAYARCFNRCAPPGWNYAQSGIINSANAVITWPARWRSAGGGAGRAARDPRWKPAGGLSSAVRPGAQLPGLLLMRVIAGFGAGLICPGARAAADRLVAPQRAVERLLAGPGIGITPGLLVRYAGAPPSWDWASGGAAALALALIEPSLRRAGPGLPAEPASAHVRSLFVLSDYLRLWPVMSAACRAGYIGYMTFVVAFLQSMHVAPIVAGVLGAGAGRRHRLRADRPAAGATNTLAPSVGC
jgi:hypothetical protein